jgi:hypothetical protein
MKQIEDVPRTAEPIRRRLPPPADRYRPPYLGAALAGLAVWILYAITLAPTTQFWDTSEYIATAHILGIPHPPGNPLFVIMARAWELLLAPTGLSVAVRVNLFSATMSALAHAFWFLLAHRILAFYSTDRVFRMVGAAAAVLISATAFTVWNQSNVNEKVYTVSLFTIALLSWLAFHWRDNLGEGKDDNLVLLMVFILALSVGNHLMAFLAAPALLLFILVVHPKTLANWKMYPAAVLAVVLGLSVHLYLPIRSGLDPIINEADPTCATLTGAIQSVVTMGATGCEELSAALTRKQYDKPSVFRNPNDPSQPRDIELLVAQFGNYFQYFDWQWARMVNGLRSWFGFPRPLFTLAFLLLGFYGAWTHWKRDRISAAYVGLLFLTLSAGLTFYLNFRYGYTYPLGGQFSELREVRERDYFFICGFSLWGVWAGIGLAALWNDLRRRREELRPDAGRALLVTSPVLTIALLPIALNWSWANRNYDYTARDWAYNLLMSVEPYAILFTNGDNDTFPLWYLQEVEGLRRDVTVMVMSYLNTDWYVRQIKGLTTPCPDGVDPFADPTRIICQRPFEPEKAPALYRDWIAPAADLTGIAAGPPPPGRRPPTTTIVPLTDEEIRQIAGTPPYLLSESLVFRAGSIETTLPANAIMIPANLFMAYMITTAIGDRPIYFAMTTQAYQELNLRPFLIRHGVAFKLNDGPVEPDPETGIYAFPPESQMAGLVGPHVDLPRTEELVTNVFLHRGGFPDWGHWVDIATEGIPFYYAFTHFGLAELYQRRGDREDADRHYDRGEAFLRLAMKRQ